MTTNVNATQPLVVDARLVAYALLGAVKALESTKNSGAKRAHKQSLSDYQALLQTFEANRENQSHTLY